MKNLCLLTLFVCLAGSMSAGLVVDASAGFETLSSSLNPSRSLDTDTDIEESIAWSDTVPLYEGGPVGTRFFGGVVVTAAGGLNTLAGTRTIAAGSNLLLANAQNGVIGPSQVRALYLWDSADFSGSGPGSFGETADSSLKITGGTLFDLASKGGTRFVIRDGGICYISSLPGLASTGTGESVTIYGNSPGLQWAAFDPSQFASFTEDAPDLGLGNLSFETRTFNNVSGVGLIGNTWRSSFSRFEIRDFEARLVQDTSLPGYGSTPFTISDAVFDPTAGACTVSWEAALNQRFTLERSDDLSSWTMIASNYPAVGANSNEVSYIDSAAAPNRSFYRVSRPYDPNKKLNVLLLVVDDLRDHEQFAGGNTVMMPNLDRMAEEGLKFKHAYCQATFCNPSRASFLTGLRPDTTGISNNQDYFRDSANPAVANAVTMPQCFRTNGYHTVSLGKILHHDQMDPLSWDVQINSFGASAAGNSGTWVNMTHNYSSPLDWCRWRAPDCEDDDLDDGRIAQAAIEVLREKRTEPFFLAVGFKKPHDPFVAPKKYFDMYPLTNLVLHTDPPDASPFLPQAVPTGGYMPAFDAMDDSDRLEFLRCYAACSTYVDAQVGRILDTMDELGLWQNTIVMLWTDHGYHQGERGWWNKALLDEYDANVPLMAFVPQMPVRDVICTGVVELVDIYPTLTELAGIQPPAALEGESFVPLIEDPSLPWSEVGLSQKSNGRSVCDGRYRYTEWDDGGKELYDHTTDPGEWYNLASDSAYVSIMQTLSLHLP
jgi:uncharacterized sulfatase